MKILAIETSCDDTCVAIIEAKGKNLPDFNVLSNVVSSQIKVHQKYGGVYPSMAKREHQRNLTSVLERAIKAVSNEQRIANNRSQTSTWSWKSDFGEKENGRLTSGEGKNRRLALNSRERVIEKILVREEYLSKALKRFFEKYSKPDIDAIAVTHGPGLDPCLWVGVNLAKALSYMWGITLVPVNHIEAHILVNWLMLARQTDTNQNKANKLKIKNLFPAICLIVSGGHTQIILMQDIGKYKILGETRDDAAGECFDKTAKILGLSYPGGPIISKLAEKAKKFQDTRTRNAEINLPRPMLNQKNYDFSFSGLKTAVLYNFKSVSKPKRISKKYIGAMCSEIEQAILDVLIAKTIRASKEYKVRTIILGGGVASNKKLRQQLGRAIKKQLPQINYLKPAVKLCSDNAVMVGVAGYFGFLKGKTKNWKKIEAKPNLRIK
jgi:N6-L-threonylcarbamoyladenine synthase